MSLLGLAMAKPWPFMPWLSWLPWLHFSMFTPLVGAPPVLGKRTTATLQVPCGKVQPTMYFMKVARSH